MSVNMLGLRFTSDARNRWKNGQPPHSTTGVARRNSIPFLTVGAGCTPSDSPNMDRSKRGNDNAALIQKRRRMESYSGSASTSAKTSMGSTAMPQTGSLTFGAAGRIGKPGSDGLGAGEESDMAPY